MNIPALIAYLKPSAEWTLDGDPQDADAYKEALSWHSDGKPPTWAQLEAAEAKMAAEQQAADKARADAIAKLAALGLTPADLAALGITA